MSIVTYFKPKTVDYINPTTIYPITKELEAQLTSDQLHALREKITSTKVLKHSFAMNIWLNDPRPCYASKQLAYFTLAVIGSAFAAFIVSFA